MRRNRFFFLILAGNTFSYSCFISGVFCASSTSLLNLLFSRIFRAQETKKNTWVLSTSDREPLLIWMLVQVLRVLRMDQVKWLTFVLFLLCPQHKRVFDWAHSSFVQHKMVNNIEFFLLYQLKANGNQYSIDWNELNQVAYLPDFMISKKYLGPLNCLSSNLFKIWRA